MMQHVSIYGELCLLATAGSRYTVRDSKAVLLARARSRFLALTKAAEVLRRRVTCAA